MGRVSCSVLVLHMLLLCLPAMLIAARTCPSCGDRNGPQAAGTELFSLNCSNSTIFIDYHMHINQYLSNLELTCTSAGNSSVYMSKVIECEIPAGRRNNSTLNLIAENILPGDNCVISGCYEEENYLSYDLTEISCTIPRDCVWSEWGDWSRCDSECGEGEQTRSRAVVTTSKGTGRGCSGPSSENRTCNNPCSTAVPEAVESVPMGTVRDCNSTCHEYAVCTGTQCSCLSGYSGDGYKCVRVVYWMPPVVAVVTTFVIFVAIAVLLSAVFMYRIKKRNRYLDHRRLKKLMGTFDPNFTPNLSTNLKKFTAVSEISVFDTLRLPTHYPQTDYITMEQLGIYIHTNQHNRPLDYDSCMELHITGLTDREAGRDESSAHTLNYSQSLRNSRVNGSTFSLDLNMVNALFQTGGTFQNDYAMSDESEGRDTPDSEPQDFVEDMLRIDIEDTSDEEDGQYIVTEGGERTVEHVLKETVESGVVPDVTFEIMSDYDCSQPSDADECHQYINVDGVCFTYPSSELIEHSQWTDHSKLDFNKAHSSQPSLALEQNCHLLSSPFSTSTPSILVN